MMKDEKAMNFLTAENFMNFSTKVKKLTKKFVGAKKLTNFSKNMEKSIKMPSIEQDSGSPEKLVRRSSKLGPALATSISPATTRRGRLMNHASDTSCRRKRFNFCAKNQIRAVFEAAWANLNATTFWPKSAIFDRPNKKKGRVRESKPCVGENEPVKRKIYLENSQCKAYSETKMKHKDTRKE